MGAWGGYGASGLVQNEPRRVDHALKVDRAGSLRGTSRRDALAHRDGRIPCMIVLHGIAFDLSRIADACRRAGVVRLYVFGSILTDRFGADSDIDFLIETDPQRPVGLFALGGLQMDLSELLGRSVHLTLLGGVPASDRAGVLAKARMLDAA